MSHKAYIMSRSEAREQAAEIPDPIDTVISPSDVDDSAESWDDIDRDLLDAEILMVVREMDIRNNPDYREIAENLALSLLMEEMPRVNMRVLVFRKPKTAVVEEQIWPGQVSVSQAKEWLLEEDAIPSHYLNEAYDEVRLGVMEGMRPEVLEYE